jgi:hypothetical protein
MRRRPRHVVAYPDELLVMPNLAYQGSKAAKYTLMVCWKRGRVQTRKHVRQSSCVCKTRDCGLIHMRRQSMTKANVLIAD